MEQGIVLESVWVAVGFIVFVALVWRKAGSAIGATSSISYLCYKCWTA